MNLDNLSKISGNKSKKIRVGRGYGSGKGGHTVGAGMKGQKSRSGGKISKGFEGGQNPLYKKLPKVGGFKNHAAKQPASVNVSELNIFRNGAKVTPSDLVEKGLLRKLPKYGVKLLGNGDLEKKLSFSGFFYSKYAREKIEKSEGSIKE